MTGQIIPAAAETPAPELATRAMTMSERACALVVADQDGYDRASELAKGIKALRQQAESHHRPVIEAANRTWKAALAALQSIDTPLKGAESILKDKIGCFVEIRRREEEAARLRAQEEARRRAEEEQEALLAAAEAEGASVAEIEAIIEEPIVVSAVKVAPTFEAAKGVSTRETWSAEVVSVKALCTAIANGTVSSELVLPNMVALNGMARAMKATMNIPGVKAVRKTGVAIGGR
jgi:hypothetical protein